MSVKDPWFKPRRKPDEKIGDHDRPLILRWHIARKSRVPFLSRLLENVYLHNVVGSDNTRGLHDHPWWNVSIVLWGGYYEHAPLHHQGYTEGWDRRTTCKWRGIGSVVFRNASAAHRLEIPKHPVEQTWTLFITGRKSREWGFYCPGGWTHWTWFSGTGCS